MRERRERERVLTAFAIEENQRHGRVVMRVGTSHDEHSSLEVLRDERVAGRHVMILRDPSDGRMVVVDPEWRKTRGRDMDVSSPRPVPLPGEREPGRER